MDEKTPESRELSDAAGTTSARRRQAHRFLTDAVHSGESPDPTSGALEPPLVLSSTYAFEDAADAAAQFTGETDGYIYGRWRNPTVEVFERKMATLEAGEAAVAFASGMAAIHGVLSSLVKPGGRIVAPVAIYAETAKLLREHYRTFGVTVDFADLSDEEACASALSTPADVVWVETPANPNLRLVDLVSIASQAHGMGARVVVDNTFATPWHQQPLTFGADVVVHSATKGICGHGDAVGGVAVASGGLCASIKGTGVRAMGGAMAPQVAYLLNRGVKTLGLRMAHASASAQALAERLESDPRIAQVYYPGLKTHPQHALAQRQMRHGFGAMLAVEVAGGLEAGRRAYDRVQVFSRAVSLGDVKSLITHAATTTHASMSAEDRARGGIGEGLLRLSVGIEDVEDLFEDLDHALG